MSKYKVNINWDARVRGYITQVVEVETEEKVREILYCTIDVDYNKSSEADFEWNIEGVTKL